MITKVVSQTRHQLYKRQRGRVQRNTQDFPTKSKNVQHKRLKIEVLTEINHRARQTNDTATCNINNDYDQNLINGTCS